MLFGFCQPGVDDWQYLKAPKSSQIVHYVINRLNWLPGNGTGPLETGWIAPLAGYGKVILTVAPLNGTGTGGSGTVTSQLNPAGTVTPTTMNLADVAAGVWDDLFGQAFDIMAGAYPNAILRIGDEMYGAGVYPWQGPSVGAANKAAYQHLVTLARVSSSTFEFEWCGAMDMSSQSGYTFQNVQDFYPGDAYADYLSGDVFDAATGYVGQAGWDRWILRFGASFQFAKDHGKPYGISSWGIYYISQTGVGNDDDWAFVQAAYNWMQDNQADLCWAIWYQNPTSGWLGAMQNSPQSQAVYTALFGAWALQVSGATSQRFVTAGIGPIGAISDVGNFAHGIAGGLRTLAVTPTTVGNVLVLSILDTQTANSVSAVSGGGVTTWTKITSANPGTTSGDTGLWYGVITTAGAATITITSSKGGTTTLGCQEFTVGSPASWAVDTSAVSTATTQEASGNYPSVTPSGPNELYVGTAKMLGGGIGGATSGFTYKTGGLTYEAGAQYVYKLIASSPTAQAPAWTQTSGYYSAVSALLVATPDDATAGARKRMEA